LALLAPFRVEEFVEAGCLAYLREGFLIWAEADGFLFKAEAAEFCADFFRGCTSGMIFPDKAFLKVEYLSSWDLLVVKDHHESAAEVDLDSAEEDRQAI
jgi:hypothetical protein